jgi:O-antigen ligase
MPLKSILFLGAFAVCVVGALFYPLIGILAYVMHYSIGPERQWYARSLAHLEIRYVYTIALVTFISILIHLRKLRYGARLFVGHEWWLIGMVAVVGLSYFLSPPTVGRYTVLDHPSLKFAKVIVFVLMMTHVVTTQKRLDWLLWALVVGTLVLGWQAYNTPYSQFMRGRLERVGGPDFMESNVLAAYLACMLPIIGVQFARSAWPGRLLSLAAGVFATNAIILTRSRTALLGAGAAGVAAVILAPRQRRLVIIVVLVIALLGGLYLSDPQFLERAGTAFRPEEERDTSAQGRIEIWKAALAMWRANPWGVGVGNFHQSIGRYNTDYKNRDAHNTYVRCLAELGFLGVAAFALVILSAFLVLRRTAKEAADLPPDLRRSAIYACYGVAMSLTAILACGITITLLYVEALWWILGIPVCLERTVANLKEEAEGRLVLEGLETSEERPASKAMAPSTT